MIQSNQGQVSVLVTNGNLFVEDIDLFFGPLENEDIFILVDEGTSWAHVLAKLGCFPSISQARKNGWNKEIEHGFTPVFKVGKASRKFFTALRPTSREGGKGLKFS